MWYAILSQVALSEVVRRLFLCECRRHMQRRASPTSNWCTCTSFIGRFSCLLVSMSFRWDTCFCHLYICIKTESSSNCIQLFLICININNVYWTYQKWNIEHLNSFWPLHTHAYTFILFIFLMYFFNVFLRLIISVIILIAHSVLGHLYSSSKGAMLWNHMECHHCFREDYIHSKTEQKAEFPYTSCLPRMSTHFRLLSQHVSEWGVYYDWGASTDTSLSPKDYGFILVFTLGCIFC